MSHRRDRRLIHANTNLAIGHGTAPVQALASYCNYVAIYRHNPMGLKVSVIPEVKDVAGKKDAPGVNEQQHAILQKIAWETVSEYPYAGLAAKAAAAP